MWSMSFGISAEVLQTASPAMLSVGRFMIGLLVLVPLAARRPGFTRTLRRPRTIILGLLGAALYYSLTNVGLVFTSAGTAALSNAALPAFTALLGLLVLRERLAVRTIVGLGRATVGVIIVAGSGLSVDIGVILCLVGLACYALYTVLLRKDSITASASPPSWGRGATAGRHTSWRVEPLVLATATAIWGTAIMLPWLGFEAVTGTSSLPSGWVGLGGLPFLGVVITAPTLVLFNYGAERLPAAITGVLTAAIPALGYLFALLLGEQPDTFTALGGAIALVGVVIASFAPPGSMLPPPDDLVGGGTHRGR
nr:DMT family transporter [Alpinimonas psychrophila]